MGAIQQLTRGLSPPGAFSPSSLSGLKLWLKADAGTFQDSLFATPATTDADPVGGWQDQSGNGKHMLQATSTKRVTLKTGANGQNGKAVVRGDGVDDLLASATVASTVTDNFTVFVVSKPIADPTSVLVFQNGISSGHGYYFSGGVSPNVARKVLYDNVAFMSDSSMLTHVCEVASYKRAAGTTTLRINGAAETLTVPTSTPITPATSTNVFGPYASNYFAGDIAEILLYDAALTAPEIAQVETYLNARWAVF